MKLSFIFPQISRLFSAPRVSSAVRWGEKILLWSLFMAFLGINTFFIIRRPFALSDYFSALLSQPFAPLAHIVTARELWDNGYHTTAQHEMNIAQDLYQAAGGVVLGLTSEPSTILKDWEAQPQELKKEFIYWKSVTENRPDYRDGWIVAGMLSYRLNDVSGAKEFLRRAYVLDPNFAPLTALLSKLNGLR